MKIREYTDATEVRLLNRRVAVMSNEDSFTIRFDNKDDVNEERTTYAYKRGISQTIMKLSIESAEALMLALKNELERRKEGD